MSWEDDAKIVFVIERQGNENRAEYDALAWLGGMDENDGLAILPLALVQAGGFFSESDDVVLKRMLYCTGGSGTTCRRCKKMW